jgi:hypothetical protein
VPEYGRILDPDNLHLGLPGIKDSRAFGEIQFQFVVY